MTDDPKAALQAYLSAHFADPGLRLVEFSEPSSGWSRTTYAMTAESGNGRPPMPLIVQVQRAQSLILDSDLTRDHAVYQALEGQGLPAPRALVLELDARILGGRFIVVERLRGRCFDPLASGDRKELAEHWPRASALPDSVIGTLAAVHRVDTARLPFLEGAASAGTTATFEIDRCRTIARRIGMERDPFTSFALHWLQRNLPREAWRTLVHGDFYLRNLLIEGEAVSAVLDWEVARLSDPLMDVAHMCIPYTVGKFLKPGSSLAMGIFPREWALAQYMRRTGRWFSASTFRFWLVISTLDLLLTVSGGVTGFQRGQMPDMRSAWLRFAEPVLREDLIEAILAPLPSWPDAAGHPFYGDEKCQLQRLPTT